MQLYDTTPDEQGQAGDDLSPPSAMKTSDGGGGNGDEQAPVARVAVAQEEVGQ